MSLQWLFRFAHSTHLLLVPGLIALAMAVFYLVLDDGSGNGLVRRDSSNLQLYGTIAIFVFLPAYLIAMILYIRRGTLTALDRLAPLCVNPESQALVQSIHEGLGRVSALAWPLIVVGVVVGILQGSFGVVQHLFTTGNLDRMDAGFIAGNFVVWLAIMLLLCWRIPVSRLLRKLGEELNVDVYRLHLAQPLTRMATIDLLAAVGAMSFMALQSLDAEFRLANYLVGALIGIPAAIAFLGFPLLGLRRKIVGLKRDRLGELQLDLERELGATTPDVVRVEAVLGHISRVQSMSNWPINLRLIARIFVYVIIPPLAWVGAALVENVVDSW